MSTIDIAAQMIRDLSEVDGETLGYAHAHNIAEALAAAGLLMPDLPEPGEDFITGTPVWEGDDTLGVTVHPDGEISMMIGVDSETDYTPATARKQALALLAAANHAQKEETNE